MQASGTVSAMNFVASGSSAGTSDWVQGAALPVCTFGSSPTKLTQPQPCIQTNSFFLQAPPPTIATSFGWTAPTAANTTAGPLIVGTPSTAPNYPPTSALSVGLLTNTTVNPLTSQPELATVTGPLNLNHLVSIANPSSGLYDFIDSGIALASGKIQTSSLAGVLLTTNGGTGTGSNFAAHQFFGNSTASAAQPQPTLISSNDTSVNWYAAGGGSANLQTVTLPGTLSLVAGLEVHWLPLNPNSSSATLNVNGAGGPPFVFAGIAHD